MMVLQKVGGYKRFFFSLSSITFPLKLRSELFCHYVS
jgi:hypothetical protein